MRKLHQLFRFPLLLGWMLLTLSVWMSIQHPVAHAAASFPSGYSLALTESTSTMTYGGPAPNFQAQLTVPAGEHPLNSPNQFSFTVDVQNVNNARTYAPDASGGSGSTYTFSLSGASVAARFMPLSGGPHTMVANYFSSVLGQTLQSAPVTFTVQPFTPTISCTIQGNLFAANATILFSISMQNGPPYIDWQNGTYSITFFGTQTFTDSNLTVSSLETAATGSALAPPMPGSYTYQCAFHGTNDFSAAQTAVSTATLVVSQGHQPTIKLYSNPTTIAAGQTATLYIVIAGGLGLPTPTGQIMLSLPGGVYRTNLISLGSDGSVTVQILFVSGPPSVTTFSVTYSGDAIYAVTTTDFPFTNPPIPGGGTQPPPVSTSTTTSGSTPSAGSTPVPSSTTTPRGGSSTPAASSTTGANGGTTTGSHPTDTTSKQGTLAFWIVLVVLLLLAAGGSGAFIVLRKRPRAAATSATVTTLPSSEEG